MSRSEIEALLDRHADAGTWSELPAALDAVDPGHLDKDAGIGWYRARGLAAERLDRRDEARGIYDRGLATYPQSSWMKMLVAQLLEQDGRFADARPLLASLRLEDGGGQLVMAAVRYLYLSDDWDAAADLPGQIFTAYHHLRIADDHFLYIRGLPFFNRAFSARAAIAVLAGRTQEAWGFLERAEERLDDLQTDDSRATLHAVLGDPSALIARLATALDRDRGGAFCGYDGMRLAVWQSANAAAPDQSLGILDSVNVGPNDFPWLNDIRVLARARVHRRFGDDDAATESIDDFLSRQPLLFEPEHAFDFGLLDEQEHIKPIYRRRRQESTPA